MKVTTPCALGKCFRCGLGSPYTLTEILFFKWNGAPTGNVNVGKRERTRRGHTTTQTIYAQQTSTETCCTADLPDELVTGTSLREMGVDSDAFGRLQGVQLTEGGGHQYIIYPGREPGGAPQYLRTKVLDDIFQEVLP